MESEDQSEERIRLSDEEWHEAIGDWMQQALSWRDTVRTSRGSGPERQAVRRLRWTRIIAAVLVNTPKYSAGSARRSRGLFWCESSTLVAGGEHPGVESLDAPRARGALLGLLVAACAGLSRHPRAVTRAHEVFVALHALVAVAAGPARVVSLDSAPSTLFVERALQGCTSSPEADGVALARELWKESSGEAGRECDPSFSRLRREDRGAIDPWSEARLEAFVLASRSTASASGSNPPVDAVLEAVGVSSVSNDQRRELESMLAATNLLLSADITRAARALLVARMDVSLEPVFPLLERLFFERFVYAPSLEGIDANARRTSLLGPAGEGDFDAMADELLDDARLVFSWDLLPGIGELYAGRGIAWNTVFFFAHHATSRPRREHADLVRGLLRVIAAQWPTWIGDIDPDRLRESELAPVLEALDCKDTDAVVRSAFRLAGLTYKRPGGIRPLRTAQSSSTPRQPEVSLAG